MPEFQYSTKLRCPPAKLFEFLARPANAVEVTPPDIRAQFIAGPERLQLGSTLSIRITKFGMSQTITVTVINFVEGVTFTDSMTGGPLKRFDHTHTVTPTEAGCVMTDHIAFEPPGFPLGVVVTAKRIAKELEKMFAYRETRFRAILEETA